MTRDTYPSGKNAVAIWSSSAWWLCGIDGFLSNGDAIYAAGIAVPASVPTPEVHGYGYYELRKGNIFLIVLS